MSLLKYKYAHYKSMMRVKFSVGESISPHQCKVSCPWGWKASKSSPPSNLSTRHMCSVHPSSKLTVVLSSNSHWLSTEKLNVLLNIWLEWQYLLFLLLLTQVVYMAALCNTAGSYIFVLWFLLLSFFVSLWRQAIIFLPCDFYLLLLSIFFPRLISALAQSQRSEIGCLPYFLTLCGLSANLECMSEMCCCTWLAENTGRKKSPFCRAVSSQLRHVPTIGKSLLKIDTSSTCPHSMVNFGILTAEIRWWV